MDQVEEIKVILSVFCHTKCSDCRVLTVFQPVPLNSNCNNSHGSRETSPEVMEGHHQSSSHRSSPTDADHLQRITALTVNVGKISKSNIVQSNSSANQRSAAQNTMANSASSGGSSDPILAMEKLVKNRIPNSSTSRS